MELHDIIRKLIGPIDPVGDSRADGDRLENIKKQIALMEAMHMEIDAIAAIKHDRHMGSIQTIRRQADQYLDELGITE